MEQVVEISQTVGWKQKLTDYHQLAKTRLTLSVVLSAVFGFWLAAAEGTAFSLIWPLAIGGFLVVSASNGLNQILEKNYDKLMVRTNNRPVAAGRMGVWEAAIFSLICGVAGVLILGVYLNVLSALLGFLSLISYAFIYTPLKRVSPIAVFVGAFPGAMPPLLGWTAATGSLGLAAFALFALQFFWQFPHFWSIAWLLDDDYKRAGYRLLPIKAGRGKATAKLIIIYSVLLIPISAVPFLLGITGWVSLIVALLLGVMLAGYGVKLLKSCDTADAKKVMLVSILYNTVVLLAYCLDKTAI